MKDSKEHILLTSLQLFLQKSFKEVTMKEIVDKTGLSKGAFYHYFSSKEQVFAEVINHFLKGMMATAYSHFPQDSLKAFYQALLGQFDANRATSAQLAAGSDDSTFNNNFYYLIFDAMRMLPDFKQEHIEQQKEELKAWKKVIGAARKNGEIQTPLPDEQVAKLFIYLSDGVNISLIMDNSMNKKKNELRSLWDGLYDSFKA